MEYFTIDELTRSDTATRLGIDNTPPPEAVAALTVLVDNLLDPIRRLWGKPLTVTSGYRCPALNRAVGGALNSHHLRGMAADLTTGDRTANRRMFQLLLESGMPFTQLIDESGFSWIHLSYDPADLRCQVLKL